MEGDFGTALMLFVVGMITVFAVLFLVVLLGNLLIRLVNKFEKEIPVVVEKSNRIIDNDTLAVLAAAVEVATLGHGKITSVSKIEHKSDL